MIRKLFLALPVLLLPQFVSAQTIVADPQLEASAAQSQATQTQILQQLIAIHSLLLNGQASVSPAQRAAMNAEMVKALALTHPIGKASVISTVPGNPVAPAIDVAAAAAGK